MPEAYDATKDPRTGRPVPPQQQASDQLERALKETRRQHHEEGIPPAEPSPDELASEAVKTKPAAMKAPPEAWEGEPPSDENAAEDTSGEDDARPKTYQVNIENPAIAARDHELEASGTVCIEEYRGDDLCGRITVEVSVKAENSLTIADANQVLFDAAVDVLQEVCQLDREALRRCLVS